METTEQIELPSGIISFLENRSGIKREKIPNRYSVTDLVSCTRKTFYKKIGVLSEDTNEDVTLERLWSTVRGDLLHEMTRAYRWRELDIEVPVFLGDGRTATLAGRLDMYDWRTMTIIDLKTTKFLDWQIRNGLLPKTEHILQIQCYGTMFSRLIPIEKLCIVYADMNQLIAYNVERKDMTEWITNRIREHDKSIHGTTIPKGEISGLCQFCHYQNKCFDDGNGISNNLKSRSLKNMKMSMDRSIRSVN